MVTIDYLEFYFGELQSCHFFKKWALLTGLVSHHSMKPPFQYWVTFYVILNLLHWQLVILSIQLALAKSMTDLAKHSSWLMKHDRTEAIGAIRYTWSVSSASVLLWLLLFSPITADDLVIMQLFSLVPLNLDLTGLSLFIQHMGLFNITVVIDIEITKMS